MKLNDFISTNKYFSDMNKQAFDEKFEHDEVVAMCNDEFSKSIAFWLGEYLSGNIKGAVSLLLQMFIERLKKSGFSQDKIIRYMWLFCVGYYIKYYLPQSTTDLADRFTIKFMLSNALKSSSPRIIQHLGL